MGTYNLNIGKCHDNHHLCKKCRWIDGPVVRFPTIKDRHNKCRCGGEIEPINFPPPLPGRTSSGWVIVEDESGEKFPAVYDHANAVWRRNTYPGPIEGLTAYMWKVAQGIIKWRIL